MKRLAIIIIIVTVLILSIASFAGTYNGGSGTEVAPYEIDNLGDWQELMTTPTDWNKYFIMTSDLDFNGLSMTTIGNQTTKFTGVFDGNGLTIRNFTYIYSGSTQKTIGLFGYVDGAAAEIKNLTVVNPDVNGGDNGTSVGAIVAYLNNGTIRNCTVTGGSVRGTWPTGGLVGTSRGQIIDCHADTEVWGELWSGGLVGSAWDGLIQNCSSSADVHGEQSVGGLVGESSGQIIACFATGAVDGDDYIGGLIGENNGSISQSYATGEVVASRYTAGGFAGRNIRGTIRDCYANGKVYADDDAGGFASLNWDGAIYNCYSMGYVDATYFVGGFLQHDINGLTSDCFWDTMTSGTAISVGGTGMTTAEMKTTSTFTSAGWDFTTPVWSIEEGKDYPRMIWQPPRNKCFYVDRNATGTADGLSWQNAFNYLQDAVEAASKACDVNEIRVAAGIYRPDRTADIPLGTGDRYSTFELIEGISLKGGYAGCGKPDPNTRDVELYQSVLSGDLLGNDTPVTDACGLNNDPNRAENSYSVVSSTGISSSTVLDGFTISGGNANGGTGDWSLMAGGGMFVRYGNPQIRDCKFVYNLASTSGAGMYAMVSNCSISGCEFNSNFLPGADVQPCGGAALAVMWSDDPAMTTTINSCRFIKNKAYEWGGALCSCWSNLEITDCVFSQNVTYDSYDAWSAPLGGGIYGLAGNLVLQNCLFSANAAVGEPIFTRGGAIDFEYECQPVLRNCTFVDNSADAYGGGIRGSSDINTITLQNCIFWNNTDKNGAVESAQIHECNEIVIDYSCVQGWTGTFGGVGNIGADPCFIDADGDDNIVGTEDDNLRLSADSPCIDKGDNSVVMEPNDLDGRYRVVDGDCNDTEIVDMGAYEFTSAYYGDFDGSCDVDFIDYAIISNYWLTDEFLLDIAPTPAGDGIIDERDLAILCDNWLKYIYSQ